MNRRSFLSLAPLILVPEPRRAYSFLWKRETKQERLIREVREAIERWNQEKAVLVMPPCVTVETISTPGELFRDKTIRMRVTVQPLNWPYAARLLAEGFEFA